MAAVFPLAQLFAPSSAMMSAANASNGPGGGLVPLSTSTLEINLLSSGNVSATGGGFFLQSKSVPAVATQ